MKAILRLMAGVDLNTAQQTGWTIDLYGDEVFHLGTRGPVSHVTGMSNVDPFSVQYIQETWTGDYKLYGNIRVHREGTLYRDPSGFFEYSYREQVDFSETAISKIETSDFGDAPALSLEFEGLRIRYSDLMANNFDSAFVLGADVHGSSADDDLKLTDRDENVWLGDGDDRIEARGGANHIDGGNGFDVAIYSGARADYIIEKGPTSINITGLDTIDTLVSIESAEFSDGVMIFEADGNVGQAYRLYNAAFERQPDIEGLAYWTGRLNDGDTSLNAIADSFIHSPEFVTKFGTVETVSNARFVELLYLHTLGRGYDQQGFDYWVDRLDAAATNRGDLLAFFSESDENQARAAETIGDGIWFPF